jgi:hypothetical protein
MKLRHVVAGLIVVLCGAFAASPAAADSDEGVRSPDPSRIGMTDGESRPVPGRSAQTLEDVVRELNRTRTPQEAEAAIERTRRESSVPEYDPEEPEDLTQEPPPLG